MFRDQAAMHSTQGMGMLHLHLSTCARADVSVFLHLGNGWTDSAEIWFVVREPSKHFAKVKSGAQLHVLFRVSERAGRIALNLVCD